MSDGSAYANPSVSAGGDVGDVTKHTLEILARAQAHADTVKAQADEVFSAAQTRARELTAEAARVIGAQDGVVKVVPAEDGLLTIDTGRDTDLRPAIVRQLVAADIDVYEITRRDLSLEEIFMRLITEEASDA